MTAVEAAIRLHELSALRAAVTRAYRRCRSRTIEATGVSVAFFNRKALGLAPDGSPVAVLVGAWRTEDELTRWARRGGAR